MMGYKPKVTSPATTKLSVFQLIPSRRVTNPISSGDLAFEPDTDYYLRVKEGMEVDADGIQFRTTELLDFADAEGREITVYERDSDTNNPRFYLVKKQVDVISAEEKQIEITFGTTQEEYVRIDIPDENVIGIYDVRDSNNNKYYQVPYLGQEMVYVEYSNTETQDKDLFQFRDSVASILKLINSLKDEQKKYKIKISGGDSTNGNFLSFTIISLGYSSKIIKMTDCYIL